MKHLSRAADLPSDVAETATRATFSLPSQAVDEIEQLRSEFGKKGVLLNRSEVVRLGLAALRRLPERQLLLAVHSLERLKAGRPKG